MRAWMILLTFFIIGCERFEFGKQYNDFVDNEVPTLSKNVTRSNLEYKLTLGIPGEIQSRYLMLNNLTLSILEIPTYTSKMFRDLSRSELINLKKELVQYQLKVKALLEEIEREEISLSSLKNVCSLLVYNINLENFVKKDLFDVLVPDISFTILFGSDPSINSAQSTYSIFTFMIGLDQRRSMFNAKSRLDNKLPKKEEMKKMAIESCQSKIEEYELEKEIVTLKQTLSNIKVLINHTLENHISSIAYVNKLLAEKYISYIDVSLGIEEVQKKAFIEKLKAKTLISISEKIEALNDLIDEYKSLHNIQNRFLILKEIKEKNDLLRGFLDKLNKNTEFSDLTIRMQQLITPIQNFLDEEYAK
jgi:hypothetical protein